ATGIHIYLPSNASSGATGAGAVTSFSSSASAFAGSNALTTGVRYTPSSNVTTVPARGLGGRSSISLASSQNGGTTGGTSPNMGTVATSANAVPLGAIAHITSTTEPLSINHQ